MPSRDRARGSVCLFTKRPRTGRVKTRLCPPWTPERARALALAMLDDCAERLLRVAGAAPVLAYADAEDGPWFRERYPELPDQRPQAPGGLGPALAAHFEDELGDRRAGRAVVVGSDAPQVPAARIGEALERLAAGAELVLGPDRGGGYYLVGLTRPVPELFLEVAMSTSDMAARTLQLARSRGLAVELLEEDFDVDVVDDVALLRQALADRAAGAPPRHTRAFLRALESTP